MLLNDWLTRLSADLSAELRPLWERAATRLGSAPLQPAVVPTWAGRPGDGRRREARRGRSVPRPADRRWPPGKRLI